MTKWCDPDKFIEAGAVWGDRIWSGWPGWISSLRCTGYDTGDRREFIRVWIWMWNVGVGMHRMDCWMWRHFNKKDRVDSQKCKQTEVPSVSLHCWSGHHGSGKALNQALCPILKLCFKYCVEVLKKKPEQKSKKEGTSVICCTWGENCLSQERRDWAEIFNVFLIDLR